MSNITMWFSLLLAATSTLLMAASAPLLRGRVRPNPIYGVRTARTLADEATWYRSNAYAGRLLFRTGAAGLVSAFEFLLVPALRADFVAYNLACAAVIIGGLLLSGILIARHLRTL